MKVRVLIYLLIGVLPALVYGNPKEELEFEIDEEKQMSEKKSLEKREGFYSTAVPIVSSDPVTGQGLGAQFTLFQNGKRNEPLFAYQPYKYAISGQFFKTNENAQSHFLALDVPFVQNTPFRFQGDIYFDSIKDTPYFGIGESSMRPLSYRQWNSPFGRTIRNATFQDYERNKQHLRAGRGGTEADVVTDRFFNVYEFETVGGNATLDKTFWKVFRFGFNQEVSKNIIRTFDGRQTTGTIPGFRGEVPAIQGQTLVGSEIEKGKIQGTGDGTYLNYSRVFLVYDTRDFELDPSRGMFLELNHSVSGRANGSDFTYTKTFFQGKFFYMPFPRHFEELVLAARLGLQHTGGNPPFFDIRYIWSVDGPMDGLGGFTTLRGYRADRFAGNTMGFGNFETRWRFATANLGDELFQFSFVPFVDTGRVWDRLNGMGTVGFKYSYGAGLRIVWNVATVISIDYGRSREDSQFFIAMGHQF